MKNLLSILLIQFVVFTSLSQTEINRFDNKYLIKFTPTQLVVGELNFGFERRISKRTSLQIELGPTISKLGDSHYKYPIGYPINSSPYPDEKMALGYFGALSLRYYPLTYANAPRGMYIAPLIKYQVFNSKVNDSQGYLSSTQNVTTNALFRLNMGYQFWLSDHFALDVFMGVGVGLEKNVRNEGVTYTDNLGNIVGFGWNEITRSKTKPNAVFGVSIGFGK